MGGQLAGKIEAEKERGLGMAKDDVIEALEQPENEAVESTIGPVLRKRLDQVGGNHTSPTS